MLLIIVNWLYVLITTFCLGYAFSALSGRLFSYRLKGIDSILMAGLVCAAVYAQVFSLFGGVNLLANVILLLFCGVVVLVFHRQMWADIRQAWRRNGVLFKILLPVLVLFWAYGTSRGFYVLDTIRYHAQSIRWIEEYGVIPGQAILNGAFSYNSSVFSLSALYSLKFLVGQSMHAMCGWFALLLSVTTLDIIKGRKKLRWSDFANVAAIYYLATIFDDVISPSSDYASMCTIFFLIIKWVRQLEAPEEERKATAPYALLCVLGVYALTLKLTAGLILLLLIKPAYRLLKEKRWREILLYLGTGLAVAVPWMIRSVLISGWLFYPFPYLDLFDVGWKQSAPWVEFDAACIKAWGRGIRSDQLDMPLREWFGIWFGSKILDGTQRLLVLADIASLLLLVIYTVITLIRRKWENLDRILVFFTLGCSYLYWQLSAPLPRYGYAYVLLLPALMLGLFMLKLGKDMLLRMGLAVYGVYKIGACMDVIDRWSTYYSAYIRQLDYESAGDSVDTVEVDGVTFYISEMEPLGYENFPGASVEFLNFRLRGEDLRDGLEWVE